MTPFPLYSSDAPIYRFPMPSKNIVSDHKVLHPRCVYNKLDWSVCTV